MNRLSWVMVVLLASPAWAAPSRRSKSSADAPKPRKVAQLSPSGEPAGNDPFGFDLLDASGKDAAAKAVAVDPDFEARVRRRRTMLTIHQVLGLTTLASLAATEFVGQLNLNDKFRGGGYTGQYNTLHETLALTSAGLFTTVGLLGVLAPEPYEKPLHWDTATFHKLMMGLATVGMVTQVALGLFAATRDGQLDQVQLATAHQVIGYATLGAMSAGALALTF